MTTTTKLTVSVVMATYNGEKYLSEQIDSILAQSYPVYELIIQDDCSTDGTTDIVRRYMEKYSFIKLFVNDHNVGFNENFRLATMHATGDFVALSDQDDIWFPQKLERQVAAIGDADVCFSNILEGKTLESSTPTDRHDTFEAFIWNNQASGHTMLCRRDLVQDNSCWLDIIYYDCYYDWSIALHALIRNGLIKIGEPLNFHRRQPNSITYIKLRPITWQPYLYGWRAFRRWQNHPPYRRLYTYLYDKTLNTPHKTVNSMCRLILRHDIFSLLKLCWLCMKHRNETFPKPPVSGIRGMVRGFFLPQIKAYQWLQLEKNNRQR